MKKATKRDVVRLLRADPGPKAAPGEKAALFSRLAEKLPDAGQVRCRNLWQQIRYQLGYLSRGTIALLIAAFAALFFLCRFLTQETAALPVEACAYFLMLCLPSLLALLIVPALQKSLFSGMAELESACRFSLKEILLLRMLGLGVPGFGAALALTLAVPGEGALLPVAAGASYCLFTGLSLLCASRWRQTWACAVPLVLWGGLLALLLPANPGAGVHRSILETLLPALSMPGAMLIQCAAAGMVLFLGIRRLLGCLIARESDILSSLGGSL